MNNTGGDGKAKKCGKTFEEVPKATEHLSLFLEKNKKYIEESTKEIKSKRSFCTIKGIVEFYNFDKIIEELKYEVVIKLILKPTYKLTIGLGEDSAFETSMTIHHTYGCPYIPASAIKGVFRNYFSKIINGEIIDDNYDLGEDKNQEFLDTLFGNEEKSGIIIFFDAFPETKYNIENDNIAPHYGDYYAKGEAPKDGKANPVFFPTVIDTNFKFYVAENKKNMNLSEAKKDCIKKIFEDALYYEGIGAKTTSGYGAMK